jgi:hypothetical protein
MQAYAVANNAYASAYASFLTAHVKASRF